MNGPRDGFAVGSPVCRSAGCRPDGSRGGSRAVRSVCRSAGFSLIEILVAVAILSLGAATGLGLFVAATVVHKRAIDRWHASQLADEVVAAIREVWAEGASAEDLTRAINELDFSQDHPGYGHEMRIESLDPDGVEILVVVDVTWKKGTDVRRESFQTIVLRRLDPARLNVLGERPHRFRLRGTGRR